MKKMLYDNNSNSVRIEKAIPLEVGYEEKTDTVWFQNHNIEDCIKVTENLKIEHIHLQTSHVDFLSDPRLQNIKGVAIQHEVQNINPLFKLKHLTHLNLPENIKIEFDFSMFQNLIFLGGFLPKKYINFEKLSELKYTYLFGYRKVDLSDFANCKKLRKLWMYSLDIQTLTGLNDLSNLVQIELENCRKLTSLTGIGNNNLNLQTVHLTNCKKLKNADALINLPNLKKLRLYKFFNIAKQT
jgi:hypothetical protein